MARYRFVTLLTLALSLLLLSLAVSAQQPRAVPLNDNIANHRAIKIGKSYSVPDIGAATNEIDEPFSSCQRGAAIPHSVWFSYSQPYDSVVSLSTFGSLLTSTESYSMDTVLAVYEMTSPGVFVERVCSDNMNGIPAAQVVFHGAGGKTYHIAAGTFSSEPLLPESTLKLHTRMLATPIFPLNYSFETPVNGGDWTLKNDTDDQVVCADIAFPAAQGACSFRFTGTPGITTTLTQTTAFPPSFVPRKNAILSNSFYFRVMDTPTLGTTKVKFVVNYSNGTLPSILTVDLTGTASTGSYGYREFAQALKSSKVSSIKLVVKFGASTGGLLVDFVGYYYSADPGTRGSGLLPVPPSPSAQ